MKVYEALASAFQKEGVTTVFGLMGNANMYWWYAMDQAGVAVHPTRHEGTALSMAEGWARATGQPGCCTVTQGPGVTQLGSALTVASRARVPLVVFGGDGVLGGRHGLQYIDQRRFVEATERLSSRSSRRTRSMTSCGRRFHRALRVAPGLSERASGRAGGRVRQRSRRL